MLTLFFAPGASSMAIHIALYEIGAPFDARPLSFAKREQRSPAYLAINPEGKVPTVLIDGRPLTEVAGILFYLAKRFPAANLLPDGIEGEAQAVSWMSFIASTLHPARARGLDYASQVYTLADQRLGARDWTLGAYSIVPDAFPNLDAHYHRMMARPAVQRTLEIESSIGYALP